MKHIFFFLKMKFQLIFCFSVWLFSGLHEVKGHSHISELTKIIIIEQNSINQLVQQSIWKTRSILIVVIAVQFAPPSGAEITRFTFNISLPV